MTNIAKLILICIHYFEIANGFLNPQINLARFQEKEASLQGAFRVPKNSVGPSSESLPQVSLQGFVDAPDISSVKHALEEAGFDAESLMTCDNGNATTYQYTFVKATGMLKLVGTPSNTVRRQDASWPPRWIPIVNNMENVLVRNGWSFLDPDENDLSPFDIDAANAESLYRPKWGCARSDIEEERKDSRFVLSSLGYDLRPRSANEILELAANLRSDQSRRVLLKGGTDAPYSKQTHDGYDLSGSVRDLPEGILICAIGELPLFSIHDLFPTTASSGWLSFSRPLSEDHVLLVPPSPDSVDQRTEVLCARTKCHLGHYFGRHDGYCINASALNFIVKNDARKDDRAINPGLPLSRGVS